MDMILAGLKEQDCRLLLGAEAWAAGNLEWRDLAAAASLPEAASSRVIWLYRSPASILAGCSNRDWNHVNAALERWASENRAVFSLRSELGRNLYLLNAKHPKVVDTVAELALGIEPVLGAAHCEKATGSGSSAHGQNVLATKFLSWLLPGVFDTYVALESAANLPCDAVDALNQSSVPEPRQWEAFFDLMCCQSQVEQLQRQRLFESDARSEDANDLLDVEAECENLRADNASLLQRLHATQEEFERVLLEKRADEGRLAEVTVARADAVRRADLLAMQLANLHAELEVIHGRSRDGEQRASALSALHEEAEQKVRGLRLQLKYMQDELIATDAARSTRPTERGSLGQRVEAALRRMVPARFSRKLQRGDAESRNADLVEKIRSSRWFDSDWYLERYPDVRAAALDPVSHYNEFGWKEKRDPSPEFSTAYYLANNEDVAAHGVNPLLHFIEFGIREGRLPREMY